jgi:hypothetical protein
VYVGIAWEGGCYKQMKAATRYRQEASLSQVCYRTILLRTHEKDFDLDSVKGALSPD